MMTYKLVDTCNYWPKSLAKIGHAVGVYKGELPNEDAPREEWLAYCKTDVDIVENAVIDLLLRWKKEDCGVFQVTAPMLAMQNFRHKCPIRTEDNHDVDIVCKPNHISNELERKAYFGGRVQCFRVGEQIGKIYHIDVNSLYPYVMMTNSFPRRLVRYQIGATPDELRSAGKAYGLVATVAIRSENNTYPVRIDGKQYHCTGRFWTTLCGPELRRAIDNGDISRISTVQFYSIAPLFRDWCTYWLDRKIAADREGIDGTREREFVKLVLNSLSGKFAQHGRKWTDIHGRIPLTRWGGWSELDCESGKVKRWRGIAGNSQQLSEDGDPSHAFPLISAYISAYAREFMLDIINICGQNNVYYMATDSLICNDIAYKILCGMQRIHPTQIGCFKVVGQHNSCSIIGPNDYRLDGIHVASGILGKAIACSRAGKPLEQWEQIPSIIACGPRHDIAITEIDTPKVWHNYRGRIDANGVWHPFKLSHNDDFINRESVLRGLSYCSLDTSEDHTHRVSLV
jgi:hypothetical protein